MKGKSDFADSRGRKLFVSFGGSFLSIVDSSDICMNLRVYIATCVALFFSKGAKYGKYYSISKEG